METSMNDYDHVYFNTMFWHLISGTFV